MAHENQDEGLIRRYLLGQLAEDALQQFEEKMMADNEFYSAVVLAEDEMVEEYVQGELPESDRAGFEASFLSTPEGRQKVAYAMALSKHVKDVSSTAVPQILIGTEPVIKEPTTRRTQAKGQLTEEPVSDVPRLDGKVSWPVWWHRPEVVPYLRLAAAAVVVIGVGLGVWRLFFYQSEVSKGLSALAYAYREQRPLESRISGFNYAPAVNTRGGEPKVDRTARNLAESVLLDAVLTHPNAATHHAAGRLYLAGKKFDEAIEQFEEALKTDPNNAQLHSDYGAALLEKGKADSEEDDRGKSMEEFARAFEHLSRALELDGSLLEALFNRALCRQEMKLFQSAEGDWRAYLEKDANSKWAEEARRRLKDLEEQEQKTSQNKEDLFRDFVDAYRVGDDERAWTAFARGRSRAGNVITQRLLDSYLGGAAAQGQKPDPRFYLNMVSYAGELEYQRTGDRFTEDLSRIYKVSSPQRNQLIAEAHRLLRMARVVYDRDEYEESAELYAKAARLFMQAGDPCEAEIAKCWTGIADLRIDAKRSLRILEPLSETLRDKEHKYLLAQALSGRTDAENSQRSFSKALDLGQQAYDLSKQIEDTNGMLRNLQLPIAMYQRFGDYRRSLRYISQAFDLASGVSTQPHEIWPLFQQAAFDLYSLELYHAALDFQEQAQRLAIASMLPLLKSRSCAQLALIFEKLGDQNEAIRNGELAVEEGRQIGSKKSKDNVIANSVLSLAHLYHARGELSRAVAYYDEAIKIHRELNIEIYMFEAHRGRLLALIGLDDDKSATDEMKTAVELIEQYRSKISEETDRNGFFDIAQNIYDIAIGFSYSRLHNDQNAFNYAELAHARSLYELMRAKTTVTRVKDLDAKRPIGSFPLALAELRQRLPEHTQILEFSVLDDKLLTWVISKDAVKSKENPIAASVLNERVRYYLDLLAKHDQSSEQEIAVVSRELYETLIGPLDPLLDTKSYLCIVPDKNLAYLPFGALISPVSARYFVEDHSFVLAPSSNIFLVSSERGTEREAVGNETLLAVGNPSFDHRRFADLPAAVREVRDIANLYSPSLALCDADATERRIKNEMPRANVIHLATHNVVDGRSPMQSKLLLAQPDEVSEGDGFLQASEIYNMNLPHTRLVVLSACQTGIERSYRGEGAISVARPFLKAGVPLVVASLWAVDSHSTSQLMISFHKHRKQDALSTVEALRRAQLDMLSSASERDRLPFYWASFAVIGGYAQF